MPSGGLDQHLQCHFCRCLESMSVVRRRSCAGLALLQLEATDTPRAPRKHDDSWRRRGRLVLLRARHERAAAASRRSRWRPTALCSKRDEHDLLMGDTAAEIVRFAAEKGADLIVMGSHGHSGLLRVLMGSVAEQVVRSSPVPVLTLKPDSRELVDAATS